MKTIKKVGLVGAAVLALGVGYTAFAQQKEEVSPEISDYVENVVTTDLQAGSKFTTLFGEPYQAVKNKEYDKALQLLKGPLEANKEGFVQYKEQLLQAPLTDEARARVNALIDEQVQKIDDLLRE
ncbi:hypothetical protein HZA97_09165 [Candidatus Woesearchaeota archaeon]|nr:hypothetical protein [Candidatus Woesearchaeota archaeon]